MLATEPMPATFVFPNVDLREAINKKKRNFGKKIHKTLTPPRPTFMNSYFYFFCTIFDEKKMKILG